MESPIRAPVVVEIPFCHFLRHSALCTEKFSGSATPCTIVSLCTNVQNFKLSVNLQSVLLPLDSEWVTKLEVEVE